MRNLLPAALQPAALQPAACSLQPCNLAACSLARCGKDSKLTRADKSRTRANVGLQRPSLLQPCSPAPSNLGRRHWPKAFKYCVAPKHDASTHTRQTHNFTHFVTWHGTISHRTCTHVVRELACLMHACFHVLTYISMLRHKRAHTQTQTRTCTHTQVCDQRTHTHACTPPACTPDACAHARWRSQASGVPVGCSSKARQRPIVGCSSKAQTQTAIGSIGLGGCRVGRADEHTTPKLLRARPAFVLDRSPLYLRLLAGGSKSGTAQARQALVQSIWM